VALLFAIACAPAESVRAQAQPGAAAQEAPASAATSVPDADPAGSAGPGYPAHNREVYLQPYPETGTLTHDWFGFGERLRKEGVTSTLNLWVTYQGNVSGGITRDDDASGLYWLANHFDLERLIGIPGAAMYLLVEGGWNEGINASVGALMNVNGMAPGDEPIGATRLWYDQALFGKRLHLRLGKIDGTTENFEFHGRSVAFDAMPYGNSPRTQFLDAGLGNNASVPFPAAGLAGTLLVEPLERWYVAVTGSDRQSDAFDWSYSDAFQDWMVVAETGVVLPLGSSALKGSYYVGYWYSTFPDSPDGQGVYLGVAQELYQEQGSEQQGLGLFARYGYADSNPNGIRHFWSLGAQYQGLLPRRDDDVVALGWAQSFTREPSFAASFEGALELYYRARLTSWLHVSPHVQYIANPGSSDLRDAWTLGIRGQVTF